MVIPAPAKTADARYARRIRQTLLNRLNSACATCGKGGGLMGRLDINHVHGQGGAYRAALGSTRAEYLRLLGLSDTRLHAEVNTLCPACHALDVHTVRFQPKAGS